MSLLPQTILFPSMPIGNAEIDQQGKPTGRVLIEMNWWLFLYNLSQNVLGTPGGGGTIGLPATALIEIASLEADADDADAVAARAATQAISIYSQDLSADPDIAKLRADVQTALSYAQDDLLPDAVLGATPSAKVGLSAVPGTALTFLRSDGAPPIDQAISPTWTGVHIHTPASASVAVTLNAAANQHGLLVNGGNNSSGNSYAVQINGGTGTTGNQSGLAVVAGTSGADVAALIENAAASAVFFQIFGDGHGTLGATATAGIKWDTGGNVTMSGKLGINANSPPAQVTGWGTPAGPAVVATFPATPTLGQCGQAIGEIIVALKAFGLFGA